MERKRYHELLREYIESSGLSLSEVAERLIMYGFHIDKSYISKLQNGKTNGPASDELSRALALVTGGDPEELLDAAFYDRAPVELQEKLDELAKLYELKEAHESAKMKAEETDYLIRMVDVMKKEAESELKELGMVKVPLLGYIAAGVPIFAPEQIVEWEWIPNPGKYGEGELFTLIVKGDSMIGSRIFDGDKVVVRVQPEVEEGEIAVINVDGENATLKRVKRVNGKFVLFADNPKYDPIVIESENARICGKVVQVMFDPNKK